MTEVYPEKRYYDLPLLPPPAEQIETNDILKQCINARVGLAELKQAAELIPNAAVLVNALPLLEAQASPRSRISDHLLEKLYDTTAIRGRQPERLDLELMIRGYTINGAYQLRMEDKIGSIDAGKLADLVVLDENLFEINHYEILNVKPSAVVMKGGVMHGSLP